MPPKRGAAKGKAYKMAAVLPEGEQVRDRQKREWVLGKSFASGGFGRIYVAQQKERKTEQAVIKMEPAQNGPLFQEMHVYQRVLKPDMLEAWKKQHRLAFLGLPPYVGSGLHQNDGYQLRFLVMPLYGKDLEHFREQTTPARLDPAKAVFPLTICCLNSLEYLHKERFVHADLKAENLLMHAKDSRDFGKMVLVDYGIAKFLPEKPTSKEDPKAAHNGTLIFTSLDAHKGREPSYRGDVEILAYNILYWLTGSLPWLKDTEPPTVEKKKMALRKDLRGALLTLLPESCPFQKELVQFFEHVYGLEYGDLPSYGLLKDLIQSALQKITQKPKATVAKKKKKTVPPMDISVSPIAPKKSSSRKRPSAATSEESSEDEDQPCSSKRVVKVKKVKTAVEKTVLPKQKKLPEIQKVKNAKVPTPKKVTWPASTKKKQLIWKKSLSSSESSPEDEAKPSASSGRKMLLTKGKLSPGKAVPLRRSPRKLTPEWEAVEKGEEKDHVAGRMNELTVKANTPTEQKKTENPKPKKKRLPKEALKNQETQAGRSWCNK